MSIVRIPVKHFNQVVSKLAKFFPLCNERYQALNVKWADCIIEAGWTEPEQPGKEAEIPEITYGDNLPTESFMSELPNATTSYSIEVDECLFEMLQALARYNPRLSGRSTPALSSSNDYQGRD